MKNEKSEKLEKEIQEWLNEPIKVGDPIRVDKSIETVVKIDSEFAYWQKYGYLELQTIPIKDVIKEPFYIGVNMFKPQLRCNSYQIDIEQLLNRTGFDTYTMSLKNFGRYFAGIGECCIDPIIIDENGNDVEFQRGLVWTINQKQLLIESIYNNIDIGKFVIRKRSFKYVESRFKAGKLEHTAFFDLIDGKQRRNAVLGFFQDEFTDLDGNYFSDYSQAAKNKFLSYSNLTYVELDEKTTDKDVIETFLSINYTGVPMSQEHIDFVKSIKVK